MILIGEMKERARHSLERRLFGKVWITFVLCNLIVALILGLPNTIGSMITRASAAAGAIVEFLLLLGTVVVSGPLNYGVARMYHKAAKGEPCGKIENLFIGFKEDFADSWVLGFMRNLYIFLWSLLLIVPGIVKAYSYSMAFFIQQESEEKDWRTCLDESNELTYGYKGKLFLADLSFIGWYLLGAICFGVGLLWVEAYHIETRAHFYEELKKIKRKDEAAPERSDEEPVFEETSDR